MSARTPVRELRFWLVGLAVLAFALYLLRGVLLPFVAGMAVAYMLDPVVDRLQRWGASRTFATAIITAAFVLLSGLLIVLVVPALQTQIANFAVHLPHYLDVVRDNFTLWVQRIEMRIDPADAERLRNAAAEFSGSVVSWLGNMLSHLLSGGLALVNLLSLIFITPVVTFYLLRDWPRLVTHVDGWLPREHAETIRSIVREIDATLAGFARGQAIVCLFLGAFYSIGLSLVGLDFGLVVGIAAGLFSVVPFVGTIGGFLASVSLAFLQFSDWRWIAATAVVFLMGHLIESNFLSPKLIGERVGLHPVWIIFALLAGGALLGFVGVLLAIPLAASIGVLARFGIRRYLASPFYEGSGSGNPPDGGVAT
ncbi:MAG TPA: AI-2E family transporter [Alphaproteobacteria bacterium]|nr:AI-2E family transporter [Alphaproteobacteria bacterium]